MRGLRPRSPITITAVLIELVPVARLQQRRPGPVPDPADWTGFDRAWTGRRPRRQEGSYAIGASPGRRGGGRGRRARAGHRARFPAGAARSRDLGGDAALRRWGRPDLPGRPASTMSADSVPAPKLLVEVLAARSHDGIGIVDRTRHDLGQHLDARLARLSGDGGLAGRRHQRLQPDRRRRRTRAGHCGARRRGVRRDPDRARPSRRKPCCSPRSSARCSASWSTTSSPRRSSSATAAASSPVFCSRPRPLPDGRRARPRSRRRCRC